MKRAIPLVVALAACGHSKGEVPRDIGVATLGPHQRLPTAVIATAPDPSPPGVEAHVVVAVPEQGIGPFLARRGDAVMAAYVGTSPEGQRRVVSVPLQPDGEGRSEPKVIAPLASDATALVVRATGGGRPGFVAAWTSLTDRGEALTAVAMTDDGRARGEPIELARTADDIVWTGIAPTRTGALVVWAEQTKGGDANVLAASLSADGALRGVPARLVRGVTAWQLVPLRDGAGLALVMAQPGAKDAPKKSAVTWMRLDADARPVGGTVVIADHARVGGDVDAAPAQGGALVAWTDVSLPDPQPVVARVDDQGHVVGPKRANEGGAGGTLVAVAPGAIAWEESFRRGSAGRRVYLARVAATAGAIDVKAPVPLAIEGRGDPEIAALGDGLAVLAPARACAASAPATECESAPVLPTFVRFDAQLGVAQVEPIRMNVLREPATAGWSLACADADCLALAVSAESPRVMAVDFAKRASAWRAPLVPPPPPGSPVIEAMDTLVAGSALADLAATRVGDGAMLVTLSAGSEQAKRDDASSILARAIASDGAPEATQTITKRALPVGGVAIAGTGKAEDGAAIAWVARDAGDPQVHVTRVDRRGKTLRDVQLTSAKGDASDVAIAWTGDQWLVAWVDARDGNGEVYATTLDRDGRNVGKGQRITNAPGDASDVALLATPDSTWLAWADPRESPQDGFSDIYVVPLNATNATRAGEEARVLATAAHSRSPALAARGKDVAVGWIEEAPMGSDPNRARAYGAMLAWLGPSGRPLAEPSRLPVAGDGFPTAIAFDSAGGVVRGVIARAAGEGIVLDAEDVARERDAKAFPLLTLDGPPSLDVALSIVGPQLFWSDEGTEPEAKRARRATIRWPR